MPTDPLSADVLARELATLRDDFDSFRKTQPVVAARLSQRSDDADAMGVPKLFDDRTWGFRVISTAGIRDHRESFDSATARGPGAPARAEDGTPITNSAGEAYAVTPGASRSVELIGSSADSLERLQRIVCRGGRLLDDAPAGFMQPIQGWSFANPEGRWWATVFEAGWGGMHPLLRAERKLWLIAADRRILTLPYDLDKLRLLVQHGLPPGVTIPRAWLDTLPDAFFSKIDDAASACFDFTRAIMEARVNAGTGSEPEAQANRGQRAKRKTRRPPTKLTDRQKWAMDLLDKHAGKIEAVAREMKISRQAASKHISKARETLAKMDGKGRSVNARTPLPNDRRGGVGI